MSAVFDFTKTYTGTILEGRKKIPCTLAFIGSDIVFTVITEEHMEARDHRNPFDFSGFISTERGIWRFKAIAAVQTSNSYYWSTYSRQELTAEAILVVHEKKDIRKAEFRQTNIVYDQLTEIGIFIDVNVDPKNTKQFTIKQDFEELELLSANELQVTLHNPYSWSFKPAKQVKFSVSFDPFITIQGSAAQNITAINHQAEEIGWFFQLLFGMRQTVTRLIFFDPPADELPEGNSSLPYFYFDKEMVQNIREPRYAGIDPLYRLEDLLADLPTGFQSWYSFNKKQKMICRLFFNELNSRKISLDDKFKNYCAIIQGLDVFGTATKKLVYKGEMNRKLRNALDESLEKTLFKSFGEDFIVKLCEVIGDQRDLYQHLSKPIKYDLSNQEHDLIAVNQLLALIIRYHLWRAVDLPEDKLMKLISRDKKWFRIDLLNLKKRLGLKS